MVNRTFFSLIQKYFYDSSFCLGMIFANAKFILIKIKAENSNKYEKI